MAKKTANDIKEWENVLTALKGNAFPNPWQQNEKSLFTQSVRKLAEKEDTMRFPEDDNVQNLIPYIVYGPHDVVHGQGVANYDKSNKVKLPLKHNDIDSVLELLLKYLFGNVNNPTHPLTIPNVLPPTSIISVLGVILAAKLNPNAIDGYYGNNVTKAELETASMIVHLMNLGHEDGQWPKPWAPLPMDSAARYRVDELPESGTGSGGITTFGGTGCYLYGVKYALTKVANSVLKQGETIRASGIDGSSKNKFVIVVSNQGHYCSNNVTDWLGIGYDQVVRVQTTPDNNMDLTDLKTKLNRCKADGNVVVAVIPTFGTTDAGALEDVKAVREIVRNFDNIVDPIRKRQYAKPVIYADSVFGWIWLFFVKYDFANNPLGFDQPAVLRQIETNAKLAEGLAYADAFGADFHKTGYSPYPAAMVMLKNYGEFAQLMKRDPPAYIQQEQYDPGLYTLETSRSTMGYVSAWSNFKHFGLDGFRSLTYNLVAKTNRLRQLLRDTGFIVICNETNNFFCTLLRIYPNDYTKEQYESELTEEDRYSNFRKTNELQRSIYVRLLESFRENDGADELLSTPNVSLTTGFRYTYYNAEGNKTVIGDNGKEEPMQGVFALKCYLNSPFLEEKHLQIIVDHFKRARTEVKQKILSTTVRPENVDTLILPELPEGVHRHNHLLPALYIPRKIVLPKKFDYSNDQDGKSYIEQLKKEAADIRASILKLQKEPSHNQ